MSTGFLNLTWILYCSLKHAPTPFLMNCGGLILVFQMVALYPFFSTLNMRYASKSGSDEEVIPPNSKSVFAHLFLNSITDIHVLPIKSSVFISLFHICQFFSCSGCNWFLFTLFCFILVTVVQCLSRSHQQADTWTCKAASWSEFHAPKLSDIHSTSWFLDGIHSTSLFLRNKGSFSPWHPSVEPASPIVLSPAWWSFDSLGRAGLSESGLSLILPTFATCIFVWLQDNSKPPVWEGARRLWKGPKHVWTVERRAGLFTVFGLGLLAVYKINHKGWVASFPFFFLLLA